MTTETPATATVTATRVGPMDNASYLVSTGGHALLIDAAAEPSRLLEVADELKVKITDVLTTHRHADHVGGLTEVMSATGAPHHASAQDADALPEPVDVTWGQDASVDESRELVTSSPLLEKLGLRYVILRGHTDGGLAVILPAEHAEDGVTHLFPGDSLFPGGVGKTDDNEAFTRLFNDVTARCFTLPDDTVVHPGHGDPTTIGAERPHLDEWRERGW